jgi:hypothetical protein
MSSASTSIVFRSAGGITGLREAIDETANLSVLAFPIEQLGHILSIRSLAFPACYMLTGPSAAYVGESQNVGVRLSQHFIDHTKNFATEAFVIAATNDCRLDKTVAIFFQHHLSKAVEAGALAGLTKGKNAQSIELPPWRRSSLEQLALNARRLLFDAGCRVLDSNNPRVLLSAATDLRDEPDTASVEFGENEALTIGVPLAPHGCEEFQLNYANIWARGHQYHEDFVIHAGSEIRIGINQSINAIYLKRRKHLVDAHALEPIRGVDDRQRLTVSVACPSAAIAAKVVTGAHVNASTWQKLRRPILIAE